MKEEESITDLLNNLQLKFEKLADQGRNDILGNQESAKGLYNLSTHCSLKNDGTCGFVFGREIFLPLPKENWPKKFLELEKNYEPSMTWPHYSMYNYTNDVCMPPNIPYFLLYFGYAVYQDKLVRCPFFVVFHLTEQLINNETLMLPQEFVIDPLASLNGITPDCYVGMPISKEEIENWFFSRGRSGNPLENYLKQKIDQEETKRRRASYLEAYSLQMTYAPDWFPQELINFAESEELYIPRQSRGDTVVNKINKPVPKVVEKSEPPQKTKRIFLLRHADYLDEGLSTRGKSQANNLAEKIRTEINDARNAIVFTSTATRAKETASIIKESLTEASFVEDEKLWSDKKHLPDQNWLKNQINNFGGETLIIISHLEYVQYLPEELGFRRNNSSYAQGVLLKDGKCIDFGY